MSPTSPSTPEATPEPPLLPDITSDEAVDPLDDEHYLREIPPHHG
jgi:hypothetical protein